MAEEVRVIGESGEQLGVMSLADARQMARERDLDLVEVAPTAQPPVCRLLDFGKFKYEQAKKERQSHKSQKSTGLREVKLRPKIGQHDIDFKVRTVKRLLEEGDKVKILVIFRGREIVHPHLGKELVEGVIKSLGEAAKVERGIGMEGQTMTVILSPGKPKKGGKDAETQNP
ncbi:translation initiation factor IF-3 [Dehalococcoidia bacterium]|nr:translation initiation factor IF-3 [Dehalococcoidia bacterium]